MSEHKPELPLGFAFGLAGNAPAMERFSALPQSGKNAWIARAHNVHSKAEMQQLIDELGQDGGVSTWTSRA